MNNPIFCLTIGLCSLIGGTLHAQTVNDLAHKCLGGDFVSCEMAGVAYENGNDVAVDYARAAENYNIGCDGGYGKACRRLSNLYIDGRGVLQSFDTSWNLVHLACENRDFYSCNLLGTTYERGFPLTSNSYAPPDQLRASEFFALACQGDYHVSCSNLAALYALGAGVAQDIERAKSLYQKSCDLGGQSGCDGVARLN